MKWTFALLIGFIIIAIGFRWFSWLLTAFFVMNSLVLMVVVLLQSGKAADLAGAFGGAGSQTAFGPRGAASVLSLATTWCAVMFMVCAFVMVLRTDKAVEQGGGSVLQDISRSAPAKTPAKAPAKAPVTPMPQSSTPQTTPPASNTSPAAKTPPSQSAPAQPKKP